MSRRSSVGGSTLRSMARRIEQSALVWRARLRGGQRGLPGREVDRQERVQREGELDDGEQQDEEEREDQAELDQRLATSGSPRSAALTSRLGPPIGGTLGRRSNERDPIRSRHVSNEYRIKSLLATLHRYRRWYRVGTGSVRGGGAMHRTGLHRCALDDPGRTLRSPSDRRIGSAGGPGIARMLRAAARGRSPGRDG